MSIIVFTILLLLGAYCAGLLGSLTGLGGGVIVIPLLTLVFGIDFHYAIGAALVASIATSSGSASAYVKEGMTNIRLGMFLEIATSIGAVIGAAVALWDAHQWYSYRFRRSSPSHNSLTISSESRLCQCKGSRLAMKLKLFGSYPTKEGRSQKYELTNVSGGFSVMVLAGALSGLLGIGSGALKS